MEKENIITNENTSIVETPQNSPAVVGGDKDKQIWNYGDIEEKILSIALTNKIFFITIKDHIRKENFLLPMHGYLFQMLKIFYEKNGFVPTKEILLSAINRQYAKTNPDNCEKMRKFVERIYDRDFITPNELSYITGEIDNYIKYNKLKEAILKSVDLVTKGNNDKVLELIKDAVRFSSKIENLSDLSEDIEKRYLKLTDPFNTAGTMLPTLNLNLEGGFHRGELNIIMAASGYGKSSLLLNFAVWYLKKDLNVLYYTFELSKEQIQLRMDKNLWNKGTEEIKKDWHELKEKYDILKKSTKGKLFVIEDTQYTCSKGDIERTLDNLKNFNDFQPDIIVIDYLELMQTKDAFSSYKMMKENDRQKIITSDLRNLAKERQCIVVTATQSNREIFKIDKEGEEQVNEQAAIGESIDKIRIADTFFIILQTKEEREKDEARLRIIKNRHGNINTDINIIVNYDKMKIEEKII